MSKKAVLIILDGYGLAAPTAGNAVAQAKKPNLDKLFSSNPYSTLSVCPPVRWATPRSATPIWVPVV